MKSRAGFTLIEIIVALAIMALMMTALLSFVFSMTEIWGHGSENASSNNTSTLSPATSNR